MTMSAPKLAVDDCVSKVGNQLKSSPNSFGPRKSEQRVAPNGRIFVLRRGWVMRISSIIVLGLITIYNVYQGVLLGDPLVVYSTLMPLHALMLFTFGWVLYRNPAKGMIGDDLVSVVIPVYNQKNMIEIVIDAIHQSTYKNIEVIAVNDGSKDGTKEVLNDLAKKYPTLRVIHKKNEGKRKAVARGIYASTGKYVVLIDSDSVVDSNAINEFMKTFNSDDKIGAVVGYAKVWNADKNLLTKCQDAWYDYAFNIHKTCESSFGNVLCCSGCLAGYRREAIIDFIPYWTQAKIHNSDDRDLTSYAIATPWAKNELAPAIAERFTTRLAKNMADYDDSEDRALTSHAIIEWKAVYVSTALVYTDVPEKIRGYLKQQKRWKKGYARSSFYVSAFFWRKNPLISLIFYTEFMTTFTAPVITLIVFIYEPFILKEFWIPAVFLLGSALTGLIQGLDYKFRDPSAKNWKYKPLMNLITTFVLSWLIIPALWNYKRNEWLTR
jgi:hyaluronan synthase